MATLDDWTEQVARALDLPGVQRDAAERALVLDLARDVAHGVARPAAPLTAYLAGIAVGRGAAAADVAATISRLAAGWPAANPSPDRD